MRLQDAVFQHVLRYTNSVEGPVQLFGNWYVHGESGLPLSADKSKGKLPEGFCYFQSAVPGGVPKDFRLLRRHLAANGADNVPLVHISDPVDLRNMRSDTRTVMVRVAPDGRWLTRSRIDRVLDNLLGDSAVSPGTVFDTVFADGRPCQLDTRQLAEEHIFYNRTALCTLGEKNFALGRGEFGERVVFEDR